MRTLVISDLHLGGRGGRDVLRQPAALDALRAALSGVDRLVLLGDVVELLEGRTAAALSEALPILRRIGEAMEGGDIVLVPGNHDHLLVRAWLKRRRAQEQPLGAATQVPRDATPELTELTTALRPRHGRIRVHYPGAWLGPHVYAHHGHYVDQHLVAGPIARLLKSAGATSATGNGLDPSAVRSPADVYESGRARTVAAASLVVRELPPGFEDGVERLGGLARSLGKAVLGRDGGQSPQAQARNARIAAISSLWLDRRLERAGLLALRRVAEDLGVLPRAHHVLFGHVHRLGPLSVKEARGAWHPDAVGRQGDGDGGAPWLWNSGSWVYEPLVVRATDRQSPFWPGGALRLTDDRTPEVLRLLDDVPLEHLLPPPPERGAR